MRGRCRRCGQFTSGDEYCKPHSQEFPGCINYQGTERFNVCKPNIPWSCRRSQAEGKCVGNVIVPGTNNSPTHAIVNRQTGEVVATGSSGKELLENFANSDVYKEIRGDKNGTKSDRRSKD